MESVNICPDLYFFCATGSGNNGSGIVASTTFKGVDIPESVYAHKSLGNINFRSYFPFQGFFQTIAYNINIGIFQALYMHKIFGVQQGVVYFFCFQEF